MSLRFHLLAAAVLGQGCAAPHPVELFPAAAPFVEPSPLHVIASVDGSADAATWELARALASAVHRATSDWAARHREQRPGGWELRLALEAGEGVGARVTLSATLGQAFLAQTRVHCGQPSLQACLDSLGHDVLGWLEGVSP